MEVGRATGNIPELLAPAGSPAAFHAALAAGADAIYCALGGAFNARRSADSFTESDFRGACRAAHLAGVRVYVPLNVVIREDEMDAAVAHALRAWKFGADAFIVQDWGLMRRLRRDHPELEIHVSTQANVHDPRGVALAREIGATRVTLSRELSLAEIEAICSSEAQAGDAGAQIEVFGHGALCFCYSGVCMLSSMRAASENVRSANRGLCAQPCRLPYDLVDGDGELLSAPGREKPLCPKDANTVSDLSALSAAGISSLKVEGRMKSPDYVYSVVSVYREALDSLVTGGTGSLDELEAEAFTARLRRAFNRDFTDAYLHGTSGDEMMSYERSNNRGALVGEVLGSESLGTRYIRKDGSRSGRARGKRITPAETTIVLSDYVEAGDLLEIRPVDDPERFLTAPVREDARAGERISVRTARPMPEGSVVRCIRSQRSLDEASRVVSAAESGMALRRRPVHARVTARLGEPFTVELSCAEKDPGSELRVVAQGATVEAARTRAVSEEDIAEHVGRMGSTPFELASLDVELDAEVGMSFSEVHAVRTRACEELERVILEPWNSRANTKAASRPEVSGDTTRSGNGPSELRICVKVATPDMAQAALDAGADDVYVETHDLAEHASWPKDIVPMLSEIRRDSSEESVESVLATARRATAGNISDLVAAKERAVEMEVASTIPVHNTEALRAMGELGARGVWFSPELTLEEMCSLASATELSCGATVYGFERLMTSEHCVLQVADRCVEDCSRCALRRRKLYLRDEDGARYRTTIDRAGRSRIYHSEALDAVPEIPEMLAAGITSFLLDASLLEIPEMLSQIERIKRAIAGERLPRETGASSGHLYRILM